jgi:hypothetical protein
MSLPARILAMLMVLLITFAAGWGAAVRKAHRDALADQLQQSEANREAERLANRSMSRISDALTQDRLRSDRAAADAAGRLRQLAATVTGPAPGCPSRDADTRPAVGVLRDEDRDDLVALALEADGVADRLRACQAAMKAPDPETR